MTPMLSRVAESIYWMNRQIERAPGRLLLEDAEETHRILEVRPKAEGIEGWTKEVGVHRGRG